MARRRFYRPFKRSYGSKKRWASNIKQGTLVNSGQVLVENSTGSSTPTPVILKAGNFKIQGDVTIQSGPGTAVVHCDVFLIYAPEGISTSISDLHGSMLAHPEWVMGWTALDTPISSTGTVSGNKFSISSRLKRNLNSGDRIILFLDNRNTSFNVQVDFTAQYFTCAN